MDQGNTRSRSRSLRSSFTPFCACESPRSLVRERGRDDDESSERRKKWPTGPCYVCLSFSLSQHIKRGFALSLSLTLSINTIKCPAVCFHTSSLSPRSCPPPSHFLERALTSVFAEMPTLLSCLPFNSSFFLSFLLSFFFFHCGLFLSAQRR